MTVPKSAWFIRELHASVAIFDFPLGPCHHSLTPLIQWLLSRVNRCRQAIISSCNVDRSPKQTGINLRTSNVWVDIGVEWIAKQQLMEIAIFILCKSFALFFWSFQREKKQNFELFYSEIADWDLWKFFINWFSFCSCPTAIKFEMKCAPKIARMTWLKQIQFIVVCEIACPLKNLASTISRWYLGANSPK
jgi:hypothetical protein